MSLWCVKIICRAPIPFIHPVPNNFVNLTDESILRRASKTLYYRLEVSTFGTLTPFDELAADSSKFYLTSVAKVVLMNMKKRPHHSSSAILKSTVLVMFPVELSKRSSTLI